MSGHSEPNGRDKKGRFAAGNPGGGRPQEYRAFKERCREFMDAEGFGLLVALAKQPSEFALKLLAEYGYGKPQQHVDLTTGGQPLIKALEPGDLELLQLPEPE